MYLKAGWWILVFVGLTLAGCGRLKDVGWDPPKVGKALPELTAL